MTYDADYATSLWENRLVEVKKNSVTIAQFVYDGDGKRVKSVVDGETTLFVGSYYEQKGSQVTKYYFAGATRIAMRKYVIPQNMTVEYLLGDHLGSTSITADVNGAKVSEMRYKPWGEVRYAWTASLSTTPAYKLPQYTFTGQYSYMDDPSTSGVTEGFGLMFYNARWYDPSLGRFAQADTIVPAGVQGVQAWDRYAFVNDNPVRYNDPTGHWIDSGGGVTCYEEKETCSITITVLVDKHPALTAYIPDSNESDCAGCSAEGQFTPPAWVAIPGVGNDFAIWIRNYLAANGRPEIFSFLTFEEYSDGTISVESLTIHNHSNVELSVQNVTLLSEDEPCDIFSCSPSYGSEAYSIRREYWLAPGLPYPGVGIVPPKSITTVSLIPSGYSKNQTNSFRSSTVTIFFQLMQYANGERYPLLSFTIP